MLCFSLTAMMITNIAMVFSGNMLTLAILRFLSGFIESGIYQTTFVIGNICCLYLFALFSISKVKFVTILFKFIFIFIKTMNDYIFYIKQNTKREKIKSCKLWVDLGLFHRSLKIPDSI